MEVIILWTYKNRLLPTVFICVPVKGCKGVSRRRLPSRERDLRTVLFRKVSNLSLEVVISTTLSPLTETFPT